MRTSRNAIGTEHEALEGNEVSPVNEMIVLEFVNLFFAGVLAGVEIAIHYGLRRPMEALDERSQLQLRKALVLRFRILVPAFFVPMALSGIAVAVLSGTATGVWFRSVGILAILTWALIRIIGTVPINSATVTWKTDAPPRDWRARIDRAERFHVVGVWAAIAASACFLTAVALNLAAH